MSLDANPYESPSTELRDPAVEPPTRGRRILIRFIPVTFCGFFGLMFILGSVVMTGILIWLAANDGRIDRIAFGPGRDVHRRAVGNIAMAVVMMAAGVGWLYAAREWLRGRGWRAVLLTLGMYALMAIGDALSRIL